MKKTLIIILIILVVSGVYFWHNKNQNNNPDILTLYGNVEIRQVDISFQVGGIIQNMYFEEGEDVKKGQLLADIDDKDYQENYLLSLSEIKRAEAALNEAQSILETHTPLCKQNITSKRNCTSYTNARNEAKAALESAIITSRYQENQLNYTKVYAPNDGIITTRVQEPGSIVKLGQIIYTLIKSKPIWIRSYISETSLGDITYGTKTKVIIDTIDRTTLQRKEYIGRVGYISTVAEFTPKTVQTEDLRTDLVYKINVYVDEPDEFLKQGMPTTIKIDLKNKEIINAPTNID